MRTLISIIICTKNRSDALAHTLVSLGQCQLPEYADVELIVVDNGSTDNTREVVDNAVLPAIPVRYMYEPSPGKSRCMNRVFRGQVGDILLGTDDDVTFPKNWITHMTSPILENFADAVQGSIAIADHLKRSWMTNLHKSWLLDCDFTRRDDLGSVVGVNVAFHRRVIEKIPYFDIELGPGTLGFCDDSLFGAQIVAAGFRLRGAGGPAIVHHFQADRLTRNSLLKRAINQGRSCGYLAYHWEHRHIRFPRLRYAIYNTLLAMYRLKYLFRKPPEEGCDEKELVLLERAQWNLQFAREKKRPRRYDVRGLAPLDKPQ